MRKAGGPGAAISEHTWPASAVPSSAPAAAGPQAGYSTISSSSAGDSSWGGLLAAPGQEQEVQPGQVGTTASTLPSAPACGTGGPPAAAQVPLALDAGSQRPAQVEGAQLSLYASPTPAGGTVPGATSPEVASGTITGNNSSSGDSLSTSSTSSHLSQGSCWQGPVLGDPMSLLDQATRPELNTDCPGAASSHGTWLNSTVPSSLLLQQCQSACVTYVSCHVWFKSTPGPWLSARPLLPILTS